MNPKHSPTPDTVKKSQDYTRPKQYIPPLVPHHLHHAQVPHSSIKLHYAPLSHPLSVTVSFKHPPALVGDSPRIAGGSLLHHGVIHVTVPSDPVPSGVPACPVQQCWKCSNALATREPRDGSNWGVLPWCFYGTTAMPQTAHKYAILDFIHITGKTTAIKQNCVIVSDMT